MYKSFIGRSRTVDTNEDKKNVLINTRFYTQSTCDRDLTNQSEKYSI